MFSRLVCLGLLLALPVGAQRSDTTKTNQLLSRDSWYEYPAWRQKDKPPVVFLETGERLKKVRGVKNEPKQVIATVRFSGGSALVTLNQHPSGRRESVSATAKEYLQVLSVYGETLPISVDSIITSRTNDSLMLYSSDTGTAKVMLLVQ